jgi:hypothetical protein
MSEHPIISKSDRMVSAHIESALIISLKESRKILGVDARTLSDDELTVEIWKLMDVAHLAY